ncbi:histidinol-phosphate transaminase [Desulfolutivibrio sulfoxidireducens]|uniref:histidinol-phosphate transaminase n=2 Tax=Desulfolutivibrio sulfoxidireducens TaxID=2773299 RepID=UPI00159E226A|nr:histidinol-phosphate transaminase [Desulfolutivibrio sulfoxidireducens]QLA15042.1 histidinol-phosphate transaminase [Desulfolutivibrio sulfoxidireducens]
MSEEPFVRDEVRGFTPYSPGLSIEEIKEKYGLARVIKLASNENPLGVSALVARVLSRKAGLVFRYPRSGNPALVSGIARSFGLDPAGVVTGNGSDEIIDLLVRVTAKPGLDNVVAFRPCFSIYVHQTRLCGVSLRQVPLGPDFRFDFEALLAAVDGNTALVFVTNPDNPSGYAVPAEQLAELAGKLPPRAILVVDEAYADFADPAGEYTLLPRLSELRNVVVLRTFSKMYGLAGLRLGFGAMAAPLADYVRRVRLPFSVNLLAEAAGMAAMEDVHFLAATRETVLRGRESVSRELSRLGCRVFPSMANFLMFVPPRPAAEVFEELLRRGIIVRPLTSYALPDLLRVSLGADEENAAFLAAMEEIVGHAR